MRYIPDIPGIPEHENGGATFVILKDEYEQLHKALDILKVYEEVLEKITNLGGPLTGEDATCFRTWAEEALEVGYIE